MKSIPVAIAAALLLDTTAFADPIHDAVMDGDLEGVQAQIDAGVDVDVKDKNGWTPLHEAVDMGHREIAELLIANGAGVDAKDWSGWTLLHDAAWEGCKEIAELLIASGADVGARNNNGETPLDVAVKWNEPETADLLRKYQELALIPFLTYDKDQLAIDGKVGRKYEVLYTTDLKKWQVLDTVTLEASPQVWVDITAAEQPMRFYQVRLVE